MFWGLVFVFLYVLYVYDDSHRHFGVLEKGYDGIILTKLSAKYECPEALQLQR